MPRYRYVIDEDAATALLASEDAQIVPLLAAIEAIAEAPEARPDSHSVDAQGRPVANRIAGKYLIGYWVGHETRTLYILRIDPLDLDA